MMYAIAYPGITWGGQLEMFRTHQGQRNFFNELVREIHREKAIRRGSACTGLRCGLWIRGKKGFLCKLQ